MREVFYKPRKLISNGSYYCCKAKLIGFEEGNESLQVLGNHCKARLPLNFVPKGAVFAFLTEPERVMQVLQLTKAVHSSLC